MVPSLYLARAYVDTLEVYQSRRRVPRGDQPVRPAR